MKLIPVSKRPDIRSSYQYSIWLNHDDALTKRIIYAIDGDVNFRLIFKLRSLTGDIYMQSEEIDNSFFCRLEYAKLYKEFVK